jgi:Helix-turn-helix domain
MNTMPTVKLSKKDKVLEHLKLFGSITPLDAWKLYGCYRLGARIWELQQQGEPIAPAEMEERDGNKVAVYKYIYSDKNGQTSLALTGGTAK